MIREAVLPQIQIVRRSGEAVVAGQRFYRLIHQNARINDRTVKIRFLDPGEEIFVFTFL